MKRWLISVTLVSSCLSSLIPNSVLSAPPKNPNQTVECEILVVGGGLAGVATAYEGLLAGRTVCLTEITDWMGGQISTQGTSALDERPTQRSQLFYSRGYIALRDRIKRKYHGNLNPGNCWVSDSCFLPDDGDKILSEILQDAAKKGKGNLKWFPSTIVKELEITPPSQRAGGQQIKSAIAIQHRPAKGAPPLNTYPLSQTIEDAYRYANSPRLEKTILRFVPLGRQQVASNAPKWYIVDATETGEIIALADVPYRLGIDARSYLEPSASSTTNDPFCPQGFTYTFAMQATEEPIGHTIPQFYSQ